MSSIKNDFSKDSAKRIMLFKITAWDDYINSRILINNNMLLQGAILANTAVEKYLKVLLTFAGIKYNSSHDTKKLFSSLQDFEPDFFTNFDTNFFELITNCYLFRYIDAAPKNKQFTISRKKFLADLDFTILNIKNKVVLDPKYKDIIPSNVGNHHNTGLAISNKPMQETIVVLGPYSEDSQNCKKELFENNYILSKIKREDFLKGEEDVLDFMYHSKIGFLRLKYKTIL